MWCCCFSGLALFLIFLAVVKAIVKLNNAWDKSYTCLVGKTTLVTGANTGIGFCTAQEFAKRGARVILACRNEDKAEKAKDEIIRATDNPNVVVKLVDFTSLESVRKFAAEISAQEERLDILVNNAGAAGFRNRRTVDGNNIVMQVNHLGPFLLTLLLIDLLKKSAPSRIVTVSSIASYWSRFNPNDLNAFYESKLSTFINYGNTKLCNIMFTNELARRLKGTGVVANSLHPGAVHTEIYRRLPTFSRQFILTIYSYLYFKTAEEGAQTTIHVALSKDIEGVSGEFFDNCGIAWLPPMHKLARDEALGKKIWGQSAELVKLTPDERRL